MMAEVWTLFLIAATLGEIAAAPPLDMKRHSKVAEVDGSTSPDVCAVHRCRPGRICRPDVHSRGGAVCECAAADYCIQHSNNQPVCGSDHIWYPSHCELHRTACVTGFHLHVVEDHRHCAVSQEQEKGDDRVKTQNNKSAADDLSNWQTVSNMMTSLQDTTMNCTDEEYNKLKRSLVEYHCMRIGYSNCLNNSREYQLASIVMFHYYDKNSDEILSSDELNSVEYQSQHACHVIDLVSLFDRDNDSSLSLPEFKLAMNVPSVSIDDDVKLFHSTVTAGPGLELKCDVQGASSIVWIRNGLILNASTDSQFITYSDGSLYIREVALYHAGNYSCFDPQWNDVIQTHLVNVQVVPAVLVSPSTQVHPPGNAATVQCYAIGRPAPSIEWQLNESPLDSLTRWRYLLLDDNRTLVIHRLSYPSDTGAYKCRAQNVAGSSQDIATVFVEQPDAIQQQSKTDDDDPYQVFLVFHDDGYSIYEPTRCHSIRHVGAEFSLASRPLQNGRLSVTSPTWRRLCPYSSADANECTWGDAVNVRNKFIYASQPRLNRLVVIDIRSHHSPVELIDTDRRPVQMYYVEPLDQLIIVCWGQEGKSSTEGGRTLAVIRQASEDKRHTVVHVWPADGLQINGPIDELFVLPTTDLAASGALFHGYATVMHRQQLVKLELKSSKYTKLIDLSSFDCQPVSATTLLIGGRLIVQCTTATGNNSCVIVDYVTDHVTSCPAELVGDVRVSPDVKYLVVVHNSQTTMSVYTLDDYGWPPRLSYDINVGVELSAVRFVTSLSDESSSTYDVLATAANQDAVIYVEIDTGRLSIVEGADWYVSTARDPWSDIYRHNRYLIPSGVFGYHLITRSVAGDSVTVVDSRERRVQCNWQNISHPSTAVWIEPLRL